MKNISLDDFKDHKFFIGITFILGFLLQWVYSLEPEYVQPLEGLIWTVVLVPLVTLWFKKFWNIVLVKLFTVPTISFGVALLISSAVLLIFP